jgi:Domain of unknown function (DU1801)
MPKQKTKPADKDVVRFIESIDNEQKQKDSFVLLKMMQEISGMKPVLWPGNMIGFGQYHYKYASGHEGDTFLIGFSPRKQNLSLHILMGFMDQHVSFEELGKYKTGVGCLYINKLDDVHLPTLKKLVRESFEHMKQRAAQTG